MTTPDVIPPVPGAVHPGLAWAAATHVGRRERNEDAHAGDSRLDQPGSPPRGVFIVCDGMGGHADGDTASDLAVSVLRRELAWALDAVWPAPEMVTGRARQAVVAANRAIFDRNELNGARDRTRAGTTVALLLLRGPDAYVGHVGDSRVYLVTARATTLLTLDHIVANREIRRGMSPEAARRRLDACHLTQALGPFPDELLDVEIQRCRVTEPSLFVLCTDGLWGGDLVERESARLLRPLLRPGVDLAGGCRALVTAADGAGARDNMTTILVRVDLDA